MEYIRNIDLYDFASRKTLHEALQFLFERFDTYDYVGLVSLYEGATHQASERHVDIDFEDAYDDEKIEAEARKFYGETP